MKLPFHFHLRAIVAAILVGGLIYWMGINAQSLPPYSEERLVMGTPISITLTGLPEEEAAKMVDQAFGEMEAVDREMSGYEGSALFALNEAGGGKVSQELAEVIATALAVAEASDGAFDPTVAPLMALWDFQAGDHPPPTEEQIAAARAKVGWQRVTLDREKGTVDLGGTRL